MSHTSSPAPHPAAPGPASTYPAAPAAAPAGTPTAATPTATASPEERHRLILQALVGLLLGMFVSMIANTVVSTSLPVIVHDIGGTQNTYTWVVTAMLLTTAIFTPVWGKFADLFPRKLLFQLAIVLFVAATVAAGFAQDPTWLIVCRAIQGIGGGGIFALSQVIMADLISPRERGRYMGLFGAVMAVATMGGPLLGGIITDAWGWRWNFFVSVPFALIALVLVQRTLKLTSPPPRRVRLDYLGFALLAAGSSLFLIWMTSAGHHFAWLSPTTAWMLGSAVVAVVLFVVVERRVSEPLVPLGLFRGRTFTLSVIASVAVGVVMFGSSVYLAQYMQLARGATPTEAGLMTIPLMVGLLVSSTVIGRLITRHGVWKPYVVGGALSLVVGLTLMGTLQAETPFVLVTVYMVLVGAGMGATMQNLVLVVQNEARPDQMGVTSSGVAFFRSLGGTTGVAAMGAAVAASVSGSMSSRAAQVQQALGSLGAEGRRWAAELQSGAVPKVAAMPEPLRVIVEDIYADAISQAFLIAAPLALITLIAVIFLPNVELGRKNNQERLAEAQQAQGAQR
ncbi:MAG: MDR family MFS transporter [Micrococcus sp.]|nr:MDR family MFS transporter [Micrococcus sp.]